MSDKFNSLFAPRLDAGGGSGTSDLADRINLLGALLFGFVWWVPTEWDEYRWFFQMDPAQIAMELFTTLLVALVIGSMYFFLLNLFAGMAGRKSGVWIAVVGASFVAGAILWKTGIMLWNLLA